MKLSELSEFYASPSGRAKVRAINNKVQHLWGGSADGGRILLHLGYGMAYGDLSPISYERVLSVVPNIYGEVFYWDIGGRGNVSCVADVYELPLGGMSVDDVMVVDVLEHYEDVDLLLLELRRILSVGGRLMLVMPMGVGLWRLWRLLGRRSFVIRGYGLGLGYILLDCRRVLDGGMPKLGRRKLVANYGT